MLQFTDPEKLDNNIQTLSFKHEKLIPMIFTSDVFYDDLKMITKYLHSLFCLCFSLKTYIATIRACKEPEKKHWGTVAPKQMQKHLLSSLCKLTNV